MTFQALLSDFKQDYEFSWEQLAQTLQPFSQGALKAWVTGKHSPPEEMQAWIEKTIKTYRRNHQVTIKEETKISTSPASSKRLEKKWPRGISPVRIKLCLSQRNWKPEDLAEQIGVSESSVLRWMEGKNVPQRRFQPKIRQILREKPKQRPVEEVIAILRPHIRAQAVTPKNLVKLCRKLRTGQDVALSV